jgi:hypothetical protein
MLHNYILVISGVAMIDLFVCWLAALVPQTGVVGKPPNAMLLERAEARCEK